MHRVIYIVFTVQSPAADAFLSYLAHMAPDVDAPGPAVYRVSSARIGVTNPGHAHYKFLENLSKHFSNDYNVHYSDT